MKTIIIAALVTGFALGNWVHVVVIPRVVDSPETKMMVVCDSIRMESYYMSCSDQVHKDETVTLASERKYFMEECRTQAIQIHCGEVLHMLYKGIWTPCDSLPSKKRKYCN